MVTQGLDSLSRILEYHVRIKEVAAKKQELKVKYRSMDSAIKSIKDIEIKELEEQSKRLKEILEVASQEINSNHLQKSDLIKSINNLTNSAMSGERTIEDKQFILQLLELQSNNLKTLGEHGIATLEQLAVTTQKAITSSNEKRGKFNIPSTLSYISDN